MPADQQALVKVAARVCSCKGPRKRPVKTSECSEISTLRPRKLPQKHFGRPGSPAAAGGGKGFGAFGASHDSGATLGACCPESMLLAWLWARLCQVLGHGFGICRVLGHGFRCAVFRGQGRQPPHKQQQLNVTSWLLLSPRKGLCAEAQAEPHWFKLASAPAQGETLCRNSVRNIGTTTTTQTTTPQSYELASALAPERTLCRSSG